MSTFITAVTTALADLGELIFGVTTTMLTNELFILLFAMAILSVGVRYTLMFVAKIRGGYKRKR